MCILRQPKYQAMVQRALKGEKPKAKPTKPRATASKPAASQKDTNDADADIEALQLQLAQAKAEKLENSYDRSVQLIETPRTNRQCRAKVIGGPLPMKGGKVKPGKAKLLGTQTSATPRSMPSSPALSGITSPSLGPVSTAGQQAKERAKEQRFPIIHELAVRERTFGSLFSEWDGTEQEFQTALEKVATFDNDLQKWVMNKLYWKELDVFKYRYKNDEDRQKAIDNAIKQYDRMRLGVSDPLWQRLLPKSERGKGICLGKIQAAIAKGPQAPAPKINIHKADGSSTNTSGDSEKDDSGQGKKTNKGGESMSRSNSQPLPAKSKKMTDGQAQAKRLLSNNKKPAPAKASPKASPTKTTATGKAPSAKGGRVLSKEFVTDSDSESEEAPLSKTVLKPKPAPRPAVERPAEKPRVVEKTKAPLAPKLKPAPRAQPKVKETINAQVAKPIRPSKRPREVDDDDSSSSGTPLSKRVKPKEQVARVSAAVTKHRASDASQNSRGTNSGASLAKSKDTSPVKSSPLASSPPTNASDLDPAEERDTIVAKKRNADSAPNHDSYESMAKRQKLSPTVLQQAHRFKTFYASYEALHKEIVALEHPPAQKVTDLLDMRERLRLMKQSIYKEIPPEN